MPKIPILQAKRVNNTVTITLVNFVNTDRYNLFRSLKHNGNFSLLVSRGSSNVFIDAVPASSQPKYKAQYLDNSGSRQKFDTSTLVFNTATQRFSDLPSGIISITNFTF